MNRVWMINCFLENKVRYKIVSTQKFFEIQRRRLGAVRIVQDRLIRCNAVENRNWISYKLTVLIGKVV